MDLERELKKALTRQEPPPGFADRVMARVERQSVAARRLPVRHWASWAMAASLLIGALGGGEWYRERQELARAEQAKEQILLALRVTAVKIGHAQQKVRQISGEVE